MVVAVRNHRDIAFPKDHTKDYHGWQWRVLEQLFWLFLPGVFQPFEAAYARCPMVLSNASSVGEIWSHHAKCVDPLDISEIVAGWKWALALTPPQREAVVECQEKRAREFTWRRTVHEYMAFWDRLVGKDDTVLERCRLARNLQ